jgi:hypothetical protein
MTSPAPLPEDRIRIFSRTGIEMVQFSALVSRSWAIGEEGRAEFTIPTRKTNVANETVLRYGNWLLLENNVLPTWVGMIDTPRSFNAASITVSAYAPEHIFSWRRGPLQQVWQDSAGGLFGRMIDWINQQQITIIQPGTLWRGSNTYSMTVNPKKLDAYLKQLATVSREEYAFRTAIVNGQLAIYADWLPQLGEIYTGAILQVGRRGGNLEIQDGIVTEDGPITNDMLTYGDGATWNSKPTGQSVDETSADKYGLRQDALNYAGADAETLQRLADELVSQNSEPDRAFALNALNIGDTFKYLRMGNRLTYRGEGVSFYSGKSSDLPIRIVGMGYNPSDGAKVSLVVKEVVS